MLEKITGQNRGMIFHGLTRQIYDIEQQIAAIAAFDLEKNQQMSMLVLQKYGDVAANIREIRDELLVIGHGFGR
jgi:hypothetical protein